MKKNIKTLELEILYKNMEIERIIQNIEKEFKEALRIYIYSKDDPFNDKNDYYDGKSNGLKIALDLIKKGSKI